MMRQLRYLAAKVFLFTDSFYASFSIIPAAAAGHRYSPFPASHIDIEFLDKF